MSYRNDTMKDECIWEVHIIGRDGTSRMDDRILGRCKYHAYTAEKTLA